MSVRDFYLRKLISSKVMFWNHRFSWLYVCVFLVKLKVLWPSFISYTSKYYMAWIFLLSLIFYSKHFLLFLLCYTPHSHNISINSFILLHSWPPHLLSYWIQLWISARSRFSAQSSWPKHAWQVAFYPIMLGTYCQSFWNGNWGNSIYKTDSNESFALEKIMTIFYH